MKLKITVDGKTYEVDVEVSEEESPHPTFIPPGGQAAGSAATTPGAPASAPTTAGPVDESKVCRSPISGVVVRVSAQVGQEIQTNDVLMVLEAMKMETVITSPLTGKLAKVNCQVGDAVQGGQVLAEFD